ncbi:MAG: methyltransferase [bacterium]|nr:methyltransferase domain-containing protein [Myxococcales bacterium]
MSTRPPQQTLADMLHGFRATQMVHLAVKLGLADRLGDEPGTAEALAPALGVEVDPLFRVLRGLAYYGLLAHREDGRFELTATGALLRSDRPGALHDLFSFHTVEDRARRALLHTVQTGETAFDHVFGMHFFEHCEADPDFGARFNRLAGARTRSLADGIVDEYDFSRDTRVIDVGGGNGTLIAAILDANPHLEGVLFDRAAVIPDAKAHLADRPAASRCTFVAGDFFEQIPPLSGTFVMKSILHDWDDKRCRRILDNCHRAMDDGSRLLVIERVMPERVDPSTDEVESDVWLMAMCGGRERTEEELGKLLHSAGFRLDRVVPTAVRRSVIECTRAPR